MILRCIFAILTRVLFMIFSLIGIWRVTVVEDNKLYWLLSLLCLPLIGEMIYCLKKRRGKDYKWFSLAVLFFLITVVPSIWILELHHQQNRMHEPLCIKFHSWEDVRRLVVSNRSHNESHQWIKDFGAQDISVCASDWIQGLHLGLLILLILGKWVLPLGGGVTRDELSQLLLIYVATAADILEFSTETLSDVKENSPRMVHMILGVWSWSMLQFPPHLAVVSAGSPFDPNTDSLLLKRSTAIWTVFETLVIQDGPFFVARMIILFYFELFHLHLLFFTVKNFLMVILSLYRLVVICYDYRNRYSDRNSIF
ncbi:hypothetical protein GJAV_G00241210 [Gymnothorax javanicus]|nr:hypothetical protein GJAV_G00241210 [Gymnothorax javanicus]